MRKELSIINKELKDCAKQLEGVDQEIYKTFKSPSNYNRTKTRVPSDAVSTALTCRWGDYTGYCEPVQGRRLLFEKGALRKRLTDLNDRRDELLAPLRRTLARKKNEKAVAEYQQTLASYQVEHPRWLAKKQEWETTQPKEVVFVGTIKRNQKDKASDLAALFPKWGLHRRHEKRHFFIDGVTKKGNPRVWCERPPKFLEPEPVKPNEPAKVAEE
jgi:hypothetical protein